MRRISLRSFLITLLAILVVIVLILLYLYFLILRPMGGNAYQTKNMQHLFSIYGYGTDEGEMLYRPTDVAFDDEGNIYIADTGHSRVLAFNSSGKYLRKIGKKGYGQGELIEPTGITVSSKGQIFVADKALSKVVIYNYMGRVEREIKVMVPFKPVVTDKKLYLTTYGHVMVYDLKGRLLSQWSKKGRRPGSVDSPMGIAVANNGDVYVSDTLNLRLQAFSKNGRLLWVKGQPASDIRAADREFGLPSGIVIDNNKRLYLVDSFHNKIKVMDMKGNPIASLGKQGYKDGQLNLPAGIAYDQGNVFAVVDKFNNRVQVVKIIIE